NQGNLVLTNQTTNLEIWNSNTSKDITFAIQDITNVQALMQTDGNFVLTAFAGLASQQFWSTNTGGNPGAYLALGTDGGLYIRNQQGANIYTFHPGSNLNSPIVSRLTEGNNIASNDP
ncbi:MAG: hypothetical protein ACKO90_31745, partial [Microcystis panniformis]